MKRHIVSLLNCLIVIFLLVFLIPLAWAQNPEELVEKHGVTFPIAELGGCVNYSECRDFCEDPINHNQCIDFAKKKGFYKEDKVTLDIRNNDFWSRSRSELGCDTMASCQTFCEKPANLDKCDAFAKKHGLGGGEVDDPSSKQFLEKAKEILGCDTPSSCMTFCDNQDHFKICSEFAKVMGFRGGEIHAGPGGCTSEETCRAFCSEPSNYQICSGFTSSTGGSFSGPGGCNSEESCRSYCEQHPQECGYTGGSIEGDFNPSEMCSRTPDCSWVNNSCQCTKIEGISPDEYCKKYPDRCGGYSGDPAAECAKYPGCSWSDNACECSGTSDSSGSNYDPATECAKYPGCSWNGTSCQCQSSYPPEKGVENQPTTPSYDPATECAKQSGCSWNGSSCQCSGTSGSSESTTTQPTTTQTTTTQSSEGTTYDPATECAKQSGCSWTGSTCQCQAVQGVSEKRNLLQLIWEFILHSK